MEQDQNNHHLVQHLLEWQPGQQCKYLFWDLDVEQTPEHEGVKLIDAIWFSQHKDRNTIIRPPAECEISPHLRPPLDQIVVVRRCKEHNHHRTAYIVTGQYQWSQITTDEQAAHAIALMWWYPLFEAQFEHQYRWATN